MKRRFNYTGRSRIPQEKISIILHRDGDSIRSFNATIDVNDMKLPPDAKVYIDANHRTEIRRFDFGTVKKIVPPPDTGLSGLAYGENLKFRVLVVNESGQHGLILAHADRVRPVSDVDKKPILPVYFSDLGQQIWRVGYIEYENAPALIINRNIPNIENIAKSDPQFIMYVYPAVIREVLAHMVFIDGVESPSDPSIDWHIDWLDFTKKIIPGAVIPGILNPKDEGFENEDAERWINSVVEEFCVSRNEWREYIKQLRGEGER